MREIKFRAWDKHANHMINDPNTVNDGELINAIFKDESVLWMQYTGLLDKNGKEIYEGDIVTTDCQAVKNIADNWVVEYGHTGMYQMAYGSFKQSIHGLVYNDWRLEVIGNIYENPELVKENDNE